MTKWLQPSFFSGTIQQLQSEFWILGSKNGWIIFSPPNKFAPRRNAGDMTRHQVVAQETVVPPDGSSMQHQHLGVVSLGHPEYRDEWWWIAIKNYWTNLKYMEMD